MKTCSVCKISKAITEYYNRYAKCKLCVYAVNSAYRKTEEGKEARRREAIAARKSGKSQERQKRYELTEKAKKTTKKYVLKKYNTPEGKARLAAKNAVRYALRINKLVKEPCFICGDVMSEAHHSSYEKDMRLVVSWLCSAHHNEIHNPRAKSC